MDRINNRILFSQFKFLLIISYFFDGEWQEYKEKMEELREHWREKIQEKEEK